MATSRPQIHRPATLNAKPFISEKARQRPVRVIPTDDRAEWEAGHLIASGSLFSSNMLLSRPGADSKDSYGGASAYAAAPGGYGAAPAVDTDSEETGNDSVRDSARASFDDSVGDDFASSSDSSVADDAR